MTQTEPYVALNSDCAYRCGSLPGVVDCVNVCVFVCMCAQVRVCV